MQPDEHCEVEVLRDTGTWCTDVSGPRVFYPDLESATGWARQLQLIHGEGKVRLKRVAVDYPALEGLRTNKEPP